MIITRDKLILVGSGVIAILGVAFGYHFYSISQDPNALSKQEISRTIAAVGKLIVLPAGETPTIATVSNPDLLKDQAFFTASVAGDRVLIYTAAKEAILYRPSINKLIAVSPIVINAPQPQK